MTAAVAVLATSSAGPAGEQVRAVLGGPDGRDAERVAALVDPGFLAEMGWDPARRLLFPPVGHPLVVRPVCRAAGCASTATGRGHVCVPCRRRLAEQGLDTSQVGLLPVRDTPARGPGACQLPGCGREWDTAPAGLCRAHADQRTALGLGMAEFLGHRLARPLPACPPCAVTACSRQQRHRGGLYCAAHQIRLRAARKANPGLDESRWRMAQPAIGRGGEVSLRGLPPLVVAQVLYGLQQRCHVDGVKTKESDLRLVCEDLRRQQVTTIADLDITGRRDACYHALATTLTSHTRRALASPQTEIAGDEWDLAVFGHGGTLSFTAISQRWLREAAKRWAADDLPRRRSKAGKAGLVVRHHLGCLARLSESLRMRDDRGETPAALGRGDIEAFLHRLAYLASTGTITGDARIRNCREVRAVLTRIRALGLTRPGGLAAGLGEDFAVHRDDIPAPPEPAEPHRDLPPEIMRQVCGQLDTLTSPEMRTAFSLAIDTGRRPEEIAALTFDCLARDADGAPLLVYTNHKGHRLGRRLPIGENTAALVAAQQQRVRSRFPDTPIGGLALLPTDRRNPDGRRPVTAFSLSFHHRTWVGRMPALTTADGVEFDKRRIVLYAYRHTYAQRHADAGVGIDVLRELMDHRKLDTTRQYYRVGEQRRREAVDRLTALQFDRHGNRVWQQAQTLLDAAHTRRAIGEVAVPFGICAEPSNVKAGGHACPYRFRCAGCDHFRTDVSYLPELTSYLDDLLRTRERLLATADIDDWARAEAMPSNEEITRIRRLIGRVSAGLDQLTDPERAQIDDAVATVRRHRAALLGMPRLRAGALPAGQATP